GVGGEECREVVGPHAFGPRCAEPAHHLDRALHLAPPAVELQRTDAILCRSRGPKICVAHRQSCEGVWRVSFVNLTDLNLTSRLCHDCFGGATWLSQVYTHHVQAH